MKKIKKEPVLFNKLGEKIKKIRKDKGYTNQEKFAYESNIPRAQYGRYEKGSNMTILSLYAILKHHKISFKKFFAEGFDDLDKLMK